MLMIKSEEPAGAEASSQPEGAAIIAPAGQGQVFAAGQLRVLPLPPPERPATPRPEATNQRRWQGPVGSLSSGAAAAT